MKFVLIIINFICAIMHTLFGLYMAPKYNSEKHIPMLLIENSIVTFSFLLMAYILFSSSMKSSQSLRINLLFWLVFEIFVVILKPTITTLAILGERFYVVDQWIFLATCGCIVLIINIIEIVKRGLVKKQYKCSSTYNTN